MPTQSPILEIDIGSAAYQLAATQSKLSLTIEDKDEKDTLLNRHDFGLDLNQLSKVDTALGKAIRLYFLGYLNQEPEGTSLSAYQEDSLSAALATFQEDLGIEATGVADKSTQSLLTTIFGA